ncbi:hypothetical protein MMC11_007787 [Xylographa trunciseda]|nr:hypothetical protein [Xylographa trunciseda]
MDVGVFSGIFPAGYSIGNVIGTAPPTGPAPMSTVDIPVATSIDPVPSAPAGTGNLPLIPTPPAIVDTPLAAPTPAAVVTDAPPSMPIQPIVPTEMPLFPTGMPVFPTGLPIGPTAPAVMSIAAPQTAEAIAAVSTTSIAPPGLFISVPYMTVTVTVTASPACQAPQVPAVASLSTPAGIFGPGTGTAGIFGPGTGTAVASPTAVQMDIPPPPSMPDSSPMPTGAMPDMQPMASFASVDMPMATSTPNAVPVDPPVPSLGTGLPPVNPLPTPSVPFYGNSTLPVPTPIAPPGPPLTPIGTAPGPLQTLTDYAMVTKTIQELSAITTLTIV